MNFTCDVKSVNVYWLHCVDIDLFVWQSTKIA